MFRRKGLRFDRFFKGSEQVISHASRKVVTCSEATPISEVVPLLVGGYRKIPVVKGEEFSGIVTVIDVLDYCGAGNQYQKFLKSDHPLKARVGRIMDKRVVTIEARTSLNKVREIFKDFGRGSYPVVRKGRVVGMIADWDFLKKIKEGVGVKVEELMIQRPAQVKEFYPILDVAKIMVKGGYRRLPVTKWGIVTGIVLPSDLLSFLQSQGGVASLRTEKRSIISAMRREVITVSPQEDVGRAVTLMLRSRVGGLPVVEEEELVGIITESDIVQGLL